ncbi:hypothetical protein LINPERHAP1_LOCUS49 [Linum perenne]
MVNIANDQDYFKALTSGSWMILDHYLIVHQWDHSFCVSNDMPKKMVAWVRFPHLPIHFYHAQVLTRWGTLWERLSRLTSTPNERRGVGLLELLSSWISMNRYLQLRFLMEPLHWLNMRASLICVSSVVGLDMIQRPAQKLCSPLCQLRLRLKATWP